MGLLRKSKKTVRNNDNKKRNRKKATNKSKNFVGEHGFMYPYGYQETDAYLVLGKKTVISVFDVLFQYGTNNPAPIGWLVRIIPKEELESGRVAFVQRQKLMEKSTEEDIIEKRLRSNVVTIANTKTKSAKQNAQNATRLGDMSISEDLAGDEESIVDSDVRLVVKAKTPQDVENVIDELKRAYKNADVKGVLLVRRTGEQLEELRTLLTKVSSDAWHNSDMATVSAGRLFLPSSGFSDSDGVFVGYDTSSLLLNNPAIIDFSKVKNAIVFMGNTSPNVSVGGLEGRGLVLNGGSAVAHVIAESNYLAGRRTHHIVLSEFKYHAGDNLIFDMSREGINPFEVFGTPDTVQKDANASFEKTTTMMMMVIKMLDDVMMASNLKTILIDWYINRASNHGIYTDDPDHFKTRAQRILANDDHENYPKPTDFMTELIANTARASAEGEVARREAKFMEDSLRTAFRTYPNIFGKATTIPDEFQPRHRNIYYDLSMVSDDKIITGAVFLNVLAYVTNRALEGEQIVIHGLDQIEVPLAPLLPYKERIERKNIGLITVFEKSESEINPKSFMRFVGRLSKQDAVVLGGLTTNELSYINESWRRNLPMPVEEQLLNSVDGILYFYRRHDRTGALIDTHLVL